MNTFLLSLCAILCLTAFLALCVASGLNHGIIYTGIGTIAGIAGYDIRTMRNALRDNKPPS